MTAVQTSSPLWQIGFRPFFLAASLWAVVAMTIWLGVYGFGLQLGQIGYPSMYWHAHEMVFGFAMPVIAGFLLTAVPNWTGTEPRQGPMLMLLVSLWFLGRILGLLGNSVFLVLAVTADTLFVLGLLVCVLIPIVRAKQHRQIGIVTKLVLLGTANLVFYLGVFGQMENGVQYGLYSGIYLIIALILTIARRVIPFFAQSALKLSQPLPNNGWLDAGSLVLFLLFWVVEVFTGPAMAGSVLAGLLFLLHMKRLWGWYLPDIWSRPLLWVLYLAYFFIILAFGLRALALFGWVLPNSILIHMFAVGGIALVICGMMARVGWGHTGRNIHNPPAVLPLMFGLIILSAFLRVAMPLIDMSHYQWWIISSQCAWISAFLLFLFTYLPVLVTPRPN